MVLSWVMVAISAAGLVLSILFCHRYPLQKDSPFWQIFPQKKSSKRQFVWDLVFCLSLVLAVVCLVLFFASALGGVTWLGYGAAAGMIVFLGCIPIYLLFLRPAILDLETGLLAAAHAQWEDAPNEAVWNGPDFGWPLLLWCCTF